MSTDLVGESLGAYTIVERIGRGGMADVYKAVHNSLNVHRALKVILPELVVSGDFRARFQKEAQAVASLRHPNIVQVHDFGTHNSMYFMVMEFIEGQDLKRTLRAQGRIRPIQHAVDLVLRIADALEYAHGRGLIHRDIKPENVMIGPGGEPILMDFGIAKLVTAETQLTRTGASMGTPAYMAPEQALGTREICPATDIYALSIVLYELLTGSVPFTADTPVGVVIKTLNEPLPMPQLTCPEIGDELQRVIVKGAAKDLDDRYNTIEDFRVALQAAVARDTANATVLERETKTVSRTLERRVEELKWRGPLIATAAVAMLGASAGVLYWTVKQKEPPQPASTANTAMPATQTQPSIEPATTPAVANEPASPVATNTLPPATASTATTQRTVIVAAAPAPTTDAPIAAANNAPAKTIDLLPQQTKAESAPRLALASTPAIETQPAPVAIATSNTPLAAASQSKAAPPACAALSTTEVCKGVTTQSDLLRLFGGPNLTTYDDKGLETWIYERTSTQTDTRTSSQSRQGSVSLGLFFKPIEVGASATKENASSTVTTSSAVRSVTVIVTFAPDRTVQDYTVREAYF